MKNDDALHIRNGWITNIRHIPSPNHSPRPSRCPIQLLVIHNISLPPGEFHAHYIHQLFCNTLDPSAHPYFATIHELRVSAHIFIERNGTMTQYVPFHLAAWHAGQSAFQGRTQCNDFSIGVELEGSDHTPYEIAQYDSLVTLTLILQHHYPEMKHICGHSDIAPERKTDPGPAFRWHYYRQHLAQRGTSVY